MNTNLTQVVHRIRLRKYIPPTKPIVIVVTKDTKFETDTEFPDTLEPQLVDAPKTVEGEPPTAEQIVVEDYPHESRNEEVTPVR